jgi:hypothetical protein
MIPHFLFGGSSILLDSLAAYRVRFAVLVRLRQFLLGKRVALAEVYKPKYLQDFWLLFQNGACDSIYYAIDFIGSIGCLRFPDLLVLLRVDFGLRYKRILYAVSVSPQAILLGVFIGLGVPERVIYRQAWKSIEQAGEKCTGNR